MNTELSYPEIIQWLEKKGWEIYDLRLRGGQPVAVRYKLINTFK